MPTFCEPCRERGTPACPSRNPFRIGAVYLSREYSRGGARGQTPLGELRPVVDRASLPPPWRKPPSCCLRPRRHRPPELSLRPGSVKAWNSACCAWLLGRRVQLPADRAARVSRRVDIDVVARGILLDGFDDARRRADTAQRCERSTERDDPGPATFDDPLWICARSGVSIPLRLVNFQQTLVPVILRPAWSALPFGGDHMRPPSAFTPAADGTTAGRLLRGA